MAHGGTSNLTDQMLVCLEIFVLLSAATHQNWTFKLNCIVAVKKRTCDLCNTSSKNQKYFDMLQTQPDLNVSIFFTFGNRTFS